MVTPYIKPASEIPDNKTYNNHVSMVRIRSEHAIGFIKGRFQSLKELCVFIKDEQSHKFATYWVVACIGLHSFAIDCEEEENAESGHSNNSFIAQGLSSLTTSSSSPAARPTQGADSRNISLAAGQARHEELKRKLFQALEERRY